MTTILTLPFPPSANNLFRTAGNRRVRTDRYRTWANAAGWEINAQSPQKVPGRVRLDITFARKDARRRDLSNLAKAVEDILVTHGVIEDDSLVDELRLSWGGHNAPGALVSVEAMT